MEEVVKMTQTDKYNSAATSLRQALHATASPARLQAALTAGTRPDPSYIQVLVERCRTEPDFYVRDMLTWALIRHEPMSVVEAVVPELTSEIAQARKIGRASCREREGSEVVAGST